MAVALVAWGVFALFNDLTVMILMGFVASTMGMAATPFIELTALRATRTGPLTFGVARSLGSAAFMVANVAGGMAVQAFGPEVVMPWVLVNAVLSLMAANAMPRGVQPPRTPIRSRVAGMVRLLQQPAFLRLVLAGSCIQAAHAFYYAFSTNVWRAQGFSDTVIGLLWAFAVVVEIVFLTNSGWFIRRFGAERLLVAGGVAALIRWSLLATDPGLGTVVMLQVLHTGSFAMTYIAGLRLIQDTLPEDSHASAMAISSGIGGGTLLGLATLFSGVLFDAAGAKGYLGMGALAGLGLLLWFSLKPRARSPVAAADG
jgi:PPP family 3-phenylpropionic acid transporter